MPATVGVQPHSRSRAVPAPVRASAMSTGAPLRRRGDMSDGCPGRSLLTATVTAVPLGNMALQSDLAEADVERELDSHRRELTGYCYRMLGSGSEAEDAVQETLIRA